MEYKLIDVLVCPICKNYPLKLYVTKQMPIDKTDPSRCKVYCAYHDVRLPAKEELNCDECSKIEILEGVIYCNKCKRWYPIVDGVPIMLPDEYRSEKEIEILMNNRDKIPHEILYSGKPFHL